MWKNEFISETGHHAISGSRETAVISAVISGMGIRLGLSLVKLYKHKRITEPLVKTFSLVNLKEKYLIYFNHSFIMVENE